MTPKRFHLSGPGTLRKASKSSLRNYRAALATLKALSHRPPTSFQPDDVAGHPRGLGGLQDRALGNMEEDKLRQRDVGHPEMARSSRKQNSA